MSLQFLRWKRVEGMSLSFESEPIQASDRQLLGGQDQIQVSQILTAIINRITD